MSRLRSIAGALCAMLLLLVPAEGAEVTLTAMGSFPPGQEAGDVLQRYIEEYERLHPHVEIDHLPRTGSDLEAMEQILVRTAAGNPPDIVYVPQVLLTDYVVQEIVTPVPDAIAERIRSHFLPGALYVAEYNHVLYGFPTELMTQALAYNAVVFERAGLADEAPQTWEELREFARKLTVRGDDGRIVRAGYGIMNYATPVIAYLLTYSRSYGSDPISPDFRSVHFTNPVTVDAVRFLKTLHLEDQTAVIGLPGWTDYNLGMFFAHGPWQAQGFRRVGAEFYDSLRSAAPPLGSTGRREATFYGYLWAVTPYARHPAEAYDFLFWLTTEPTERGTTRMGDVLATLGSIPTTREDAEHQPSMEEPFMQGFLEVLMIDAARPIPAIPAWLDAFLELGNLVTQAIQGELPETTAMERADQYIQLRIDEYFARLEGGR